MQELVQRKRARPLLPFFRARWLDVLAACLWALLVGLRLALFLANPSALQGGLILFNLMIVALFILRRLARAQGSRGVFWLAAGATFLPVVALRPVGGGSPEAGLALQSLGLAIMVVALVFLNRSFGIAPAHRGLVTAGPYRVVRHPLYASEAVHFAGYCLGYLSLWNASVLAAILIAITLRIRAEETLLRADEAYRVYQDRVRWRLLPGVW